ncbi:hypothetical protein [Curtobacterium sp. MCSS17_007]|uniref:hypothetical protein n=1 Tax=Curtobacterium sp. MCSS17_007 TaxID=2175646 RepID=UPI0011B3EFC1|nr:hypothetical protein [Curtobacterium sp. MCSS17_007]WIE77053.1 hypothetical protein DEJ22_007305 [Curtobacterium sp. MCSS17_007]
MVRHHVTTIYPGLDAPVVDVCDCVAGVDHVEVFPTWTALVVEPVRRAFTGRSRRPTDRKEPRPPCTPTPTPPPDRPVEEP